MPRTLGLESTSRLNASISSSVSANPAPASARLFLRRFHSFVTAGLWVSLLVAALVAIGYADGIERLYRPFSEGPGTHPLTLLCSFALIVGFLCAPLLTRAQPVSLALFGFVFIVSTWRLYVFAFFGDSDWDGTFPFNSPAALQAGFDNVQMGPNTALTLALASAAQIVRSLHGRTSFWLAIAAPIPPVTALIGYAYSTTDLHGHMSPMTVILLLPATFAGMQRFATRPGLRYLFGTTELCRIARLQFAVGVSVPFAIGFVLSHIPEQIGTDLVSVQTTLSIWFVLVLIGLGTWSHERSEVERRQYQRQLASLSVTDQLTGCGNRHGAMAAAQHIAAKKRIGLVMLDLDHFKKINDRFGHAAGDDVLAQVGQVLKNCVRGNDYVSRWGGEEFLVFLPDTTFEQTLCIAERMRQRIKAMTFDALGGETVTASLGITLKIESDESIDSTIIRADSALYEAKHAGRDRIVSLVDAQHAMH